MRRSDQTYILALSLLFFFNDTATTDIYTLSLHDALPILHAHQTALRIRPVGRADGDHPADDRARHGHRQDDHRSEEHTSELQSRVDLVCRLLLEKKKNSDVE